MQNTLNKIAAITVIAAMLVQLSFVVLSIGPKAYQYKVIDKSTGEKYITRPTDDIDNYYLQDQKFSKWCNDRILLKEVKL